MEGKTGGRRDAARRFLLDAVAETVYSISIDLLKISCNI
jgi:hypothetical protein